MLRNMYADFSKHAKQPGANILLGLPLSEPVVILGALLTCLPACLVRDMFADFSRHAKQPGANILLGVTSSKPAVTHAHLPSCLVRNMFADFSKHAKQPGANILLELAPIMTLCLDTSGGKACFQH
jgi:hypothetical protein